jgi:ParB family chromosome partitioning protein
MLRIADLVPDPANARKHPKRNIESIAHSLRLFGQRKPIVVQKSGMIVRAGNATLEAAKAIGWEEIAAVVVDEQDATAVQYAIADNRTAELADWDEDVLLRSLETIPDDVRKLLALSDDDIRDALEEPVDEEAPNTFEVTYGVQVECRNEAEQARLIERLESEGYQCRPLML